VFLKKITKLQNVGKFHRAGISGGEYGQFTLFYAGNGRGKTTLCAVLRSMKADAPGIIEDRRTLGETAAPEVNLLLDTGVATFNSGKWKNGKSALHIFDNAFVAENVHAGERVDTEQRRNIYRVIVGAKGVQLAEGVDKLDATITETTTKIASEKKALQSHVPTGLTFEAFLALSDDPDIDANIAAQKVKLEAAAQSAQIATKPLLKPQPIPTLPASLMAALGKTISGVSADAAQKLEAQLVKHKFGEDGQTWVLSGLQHVHGDSCPFCANDLKGNALVEAYRQYFDESYEAFKAELVSLQTEVIQGLSEAEGLRTKSRFENLAKEVEYWRAFGKVEFSPAVALDAMPAKLSILWSAAKSAIEAKIGTPLEQIDTAALQKAVVDWQTAVNDMQTCNDTLVQANADIQTIKASTAAVGKAALETALKNLEAIKKRHSPAVKVLADRYNTLVAEKAKQVADKDSKKDELDKYDASVLGKYHDAINDCLTQFGAGFSLLRSEKNYVGKQPQWMYVIEINKQPVDVTKKSGQGEASFETAMSAGDRSTLALAFFLAQLDLDADLKNSVVVFDDPFTSLDEFRRAMTAKTIFRVGEAASQVIVLSHDKYFLQAVSDAAKTKKCETFQISSAKKNSSIEAWDLDREVKDGYLRAHMDMLDFHNGQSGSPSEMRLKMRPLLEDYIRYRFPNQIPDGKWLGDMLGVIAADANHPLTPLYNEIDDINSFTAPHHHNTNTPFNDDEVKTYIKRTLAIVGGC